MPKNDDEDRELSDREIKEIIDEFGDIMEEHGYYDEETEEYDVDSFVDDYPEVFEWMGDDYLDYLDDIADYDDEDFYSAGK